MATTDEATIFISRIERYFENAFPDEVRREYLKDFKGIEADVLSQAIAAIMESTSHVRPPPTRKEIKDQIQRIYEVRWELRKANTPTLDKVIPFRKLPSAEREMAKDALGLIRRLLNREVKTDDLPSAMRAMADKYRHLNGPAWMSEAASFEKWLEEFRALPELRPGNLHPLPEVDRQLRPKVYMERENG